MPDLDPKQKSPAATGDSLGLSAGKDYMHNQDNTAAGGRKDPLASTIPLAKAARSTCAGLLIRISDLVSSDDPKAWEMAEGEALQIVDALRQGGSELRAALSPEPGPRLLEVAE